MALADAAHQPTSSRLNATSLLKFLLWPWPKWLTPRLYRGMLLVLVAGILIIAWIVGHR